MFLPSVWLFCILQKHDEHIYSDSQADYHFVESPYALINELEAG